MGRTVGTKQPRPPQSESEQLAYYKALHFLRESAADEDEANDTLIAIYRQQCEYIAQIRPFASWDEVGRLLGISSQIAQRRFREYTNTAVKEFVDDEPE